MWLFGTLTVEIEKFGGTVSSQGWTTMSKPIWRVRLRTLLILLMLLGALLGGHRLLQQRVRFIRNQGQIRAWTGQRNKYQQLAETARSSGDMAGAAKWDSLAAYADGWRRVFEHLGSGGRWNNGPPLPKNPDWTGDVP